MQQLYEFEFAPVTQYQINKDGLYEQDSICQYWSKHGVDIYLAYRNEIPIGFAVINLSSMISDQINIRDVAEFFVMPSERMNQIGKWMAFQIFAKYLGKWEVRQLIGLDKAHTFWVRTIAEYTQNNFKDEMRNDHLWRGHIQSFTSTAECKKIEL